MKRLTCAAVTLLAVTAAGCGGQDSGGGSPVTGATPARGSDPPAAAPSTRRPAPSVAPVAPIASPSARPRAMRVTFIGDSIGYRGSFASTPERSWRGRVTAALRAQRDVSTGRYRVTHNSDGNTVISSISDLPRADDLVFVMVGTTDVALRVPWREFDRSYAALLGQVRTRSPAARLVCLGVWRASGAQERRADDLLRSQCRRHHGTFVPVSDLYDDPANRLPRGRLSFGGYRTDGEHPDDDGHAAIARRVQRAVDLRALAAQAR